MNRQGKNKIQNIPPKNWGRLVEKFLYSVLAAFNAFNTLTVAVTASSDNPVFSKANCFKHSVEIFFAKVLTGVVKAVPS